MPDLSQLPVPLYSADQPYHWEYDNLPLQVLSDRDLLINLQVDVHAGILRDTAGTQGTLSNRLNQSIDENGDLKVEAIDQSQHNIAEHTDGSKIVSEIELADYVSLGFPSLTNPVEFVRMLSSERDKLALIANEATNLVVSFETISNIVLFEENTVEFVSSNSIQWEVESPNKVKAVLSVSTEFAHRHYYDLTPVMLPTDDTIPILYKLFKVTSTSTPYIEDSLRVYINGIRLNPNYSVYYPSNPVSTWNLNSFTTDAENGLFTLTNPITDEDIIQIDFDKSLT
jgi:hypothetical protein